MVVAAASPSSAAPPAGRPHPAYKEMVVQALTELRDPGGSSRQAIGKYIADHFSGLHSSHEELLSAHLRRLKSQGQLRLVSGNYFLSTEAPPPQQRRGRGRPPKRGRGRPRKNPDLAPSAPIPSSEGPKRGPGRPRKNALVPVASSASPLLGATTSPLPSGAKRGRGRPRKNALVPVASSSSPPPGAIAASPPSGVKRGRGRPRKDALVPVTSSVSLLPEAIALPSPSGVKRGRGRPPKNALALLASSALSPSGVKRGRGRPWKNGLALLASSAPPPSSGVKRGRGRPPKNALLLLASSVPPQPGAITPPQSGVKRGRGRPRKNALVPVASSSSPLQRVIAMTLPSGIKRGRGRPRKNSYPVASPLLGVVSVGSNSVVGAKRGRGRPPTSVVGGKRKVGRPSKEKMQPASVQSADAPLTKRGPGRPRKEKVALEVEGGQLNAVQMTEDQHEALPAGQAGAVQNEVEARSLRSIGAPADAPLTKRGPGRPRKEKAALEVEGGQLNVVQMTEDQHEALPAQATGHPGAVQNEVEVRSLQSTGTPLTEKRGRGRPRKRPLETETTETRVVALVEKRGRGRPRKKNPSAGRSTESGLTASIGIKRGPGRPRKVRPFETGFVETAVEVSRDLTEERPEKDEDLAPGKKAETEGLLLVEEINAQPADAGCVLVSGDEAAIAPMDAGGAMPRVVSGEEAAITPMDTGAAMPGVDDPMDSDVGTKSH